MSGLTPEEASELAHFLNQACSMTIEALDDNIATRLERAATLSALAERFDAGSEVGGFITLLARWLEGERPGPEAIAALNPPFNGALAQMLDHAPAHPDPPPERPPISRGVLSQLVAAVVAARAAGDSDASGQLATRLISIQGQLDETWRPRIAPLLENLRALLGGADPRLLPPLAEPDYQRLWRGAVELLIEADLRPDAARDQLLDRLVHNARFVRRSDDPELTAALLRSLAAVEQHAATTDAPDLATLIAAIRALLAGEDPDGLASGLEGETRAAWEEIVGSERGDMRDA